MPRSLARMLPAGFLDAARALVRADTVSAHGTRAAVDALAPLYEAAGLALRRQVVREGSAEHVNALAGPGGTGSAGADPSRTQIPGGLLLVTHLDTVPCGPREAWTRTGGDPWALTEEAGTLYGLGCADVKLDALCKIEAARRLRDTRLRRPFWLLGTFGEEVGLKGARHFAGSELFEEVRPRQVLCGEPSKLELISAHKGYVVVRCTIADSRARLVSTAGPGIEGGWVVDAAFPLNAKVMSSRTEWNTRENASATVKAPLFAAGAIAAMAACGPRSEAAPQTDPPASVVQPGTVLFQSDWSKGLDGCS